MPKPEPFGYFRAEPFGWTDCAETDEGSMALYDQAAVDSLERERDELALIIATDTGTESAVADLQRQLVAVTAERDELMAALKEVKGLSAATAAPIIDAIIAKTQPLLGTHCDIGESFYKGRIFQDAEGTIPVTESGQPVGAIRDENGEIAMRCYGATLCTDEDHRPVFR